MKTLLAVLLALPLFLADDGCGGWWPKPKPTPTPTPTPIPTPTPVPTPTPEPTPTPKPTPRPPEPGCILAGEPTTTVPNYLNHFGSEVNAAMRVLRPDCEVGSRCVLQEGRQEWQAKVAAELRKAGRCAGQHSPGTDEIAVSYRLETPWTGWHIYAGPEAGPGTIVWSPNAARATWVSPHVGPTPEPTPEPPAAVCPPPKPDRTKLKIKVKCEKWCDATVTTVATCDYCAAIGMGDIGGVQRCGCPMRSECPGFQCEHREACELYAMDGAYAWESFPAYKGIIHHPTNPALAQCEGCDRLRVCSADGLVCSPWVAP